MFQQNFNSKKIIVASIVITLLVLLVMTPSISQIKNNLVEQENIDKENNVKEGIMAVTLVDESNQSFTKCPSSIDGSIYLINKEMMEKQNSNDKDIVATPMVNTDTDNWPTKQYISYLSLGNVRAAFTEKIICNEKYNIPNAHYDITYNIRATFSDKNLTFYAKANDSTLLPNVYIGDDIISNPDFYTFNNEYLVLLKNSTVTSGPRIDEEIYIYDKNGNKVFELTGITLDVYDNNGNIKNSGLKYTKICSDAYEYSDCENITVGEIKYNLETKMFVNISEEKSVD